MDRGIWQEQVREWWGKADGFPEMPLKLWIWSSLQQTYGHVWGDSKLSIMAFVLSWARRSHDSNPALSTEVSTLKSTLLHCRCQLKQKCLHFVILYINNGTKQHISAHYKAKLVALIQFFLCQQMETSDSPPFRIIFYRCSLFYAKTGSCPRRTCSCFATLISKITS